MQKTDRYRIPADYYLIMLICSSFVVLALCMDAPMDIIRNYYRLNISRSVLVTDYTALAGIGATLVNSAVSGFLCLFMLIIKKRSPNGKIMAALFLTMGFSLFGKNLFNTLPLYVGVWLYAKTCRIKGRDMLVTAMLSATIAPLISEIAFLNGTFSPARIVMSYAVGLSVGFIFPIVADAARRMHKGFCLYNCGTAGGFIATFAVGLLKSFGIEILPENLWDESHTLFLASFAYIFAAIFIVYGFAADRPLNAVKKYFRLLGEKDENDDDYLTKYGAACYINIGVLCVLATTLMLLLKIPVNGPVLGGIFTVMGFAAAGKHLRNTAPILLGSVAAAYLNHYELAYSANVLAILFSTGLAPISGKFGWHWGIIAGFLHVSVAVFIGNLNGGLNLYNNGFAGSFVAITAVPVIVFIKGMPVKKKP